MYDVVCSVSWGAARGGLLCFNELEEVVGTRFRLGAGYEDIFSTMIQSRGTNKQEPRVMFPPPHFAFPRYEDAPRSVGGTPTADRFPPRTTCGGGGTWSFSTHTGCTEASATRNSSQIGGPWTSPPRRRDKITASTSVYLRAPDGGIERPTRSCVPAGRATVTADCVFSPNPEGIVLFSFFVSGRTNGHTETENGSLGELKRQLQGGNREKRGRAVC